MARPSCEVRIDPEHAGPEAELEIERGKVAHERLRSAGEGRAIPFQPVAGVALREIAEADPDVAEIGAGQLLADGAGVAAHDVFVALAVEWIDPRPADPAGGCRRPDARLVVRCRRLAPRTQRLHRVVAAGDAQAFAFDRGAGCEREALEIAKCRHDSALHLDHGVRAIERRETELHRFAQLRRPEL
jgi:hypothetical protein